LCHPTGRGAGSPTGARGPTAPLSSRTTGLRARRKITEVFDGVRTRLAPPARPQILPVLSGEPAAPDTPSRSSNSHINFLRTLRLIVLISRVDQSFDGNRRGLSHRIPSTHHRGGCRPVANPDDPPLFDPCRGSREKTNSMHFSPRWCVRLPGRLHSCLLRMHTTLRDHSRFSEIRQLSRVASSNKLLDALNIEDEQMLDRIDYGPVEPAVLPGRRANGGQARAHREKRQRDGSGATSFVTITVKNVDMRLEELRSELARLQAARDALVGGRAPKTTRRPRRSGTQATAAATRRRSRTGASGRRRRTATRADQVLELVRNQPGITIPELAAAMQIQANYLYRVLLKLAHEGSVMREGRGWQPSSTPRSQR
jgi:hypothetical protein